MGRGQLIQVRRDTAANWASVNPILASGEPGLETDTGYLKYGDGSTAWNVLDYFAAAYTPDPDTTLLGNPITPEELASLEGVTNLVQLQLDGLEAAVATKASSASVSSIQSDLSDAIGEGELVRESAVASDLDTAIIVTAAPYNATGDARLLQDGSISASSTTLTSATAGFTGDDIGKVVIIPAAGAPGGIGATVSGSICKPLVTTIAAVLNAMTATLANAAVTTVTSKRFIYGTDDTAAIQSALNALHTPYGGRVVFPAGKRFIVSSTLTIPRYGLSNDPRFQFSQVVVSGYGAYLHLCGTTMVGLQVAPPVSFADEMAKRFATRVIIEGFTMEGLGLTTQTGIDLSHTYNSVIRDCVVSKTGYGFRMRFGICNRILGCLADYSTVWGYSLETAGGQVSGATEDSTPTNATVVDGCYAGPNGIALGSFYLYNCDQVELRNCTAESAPDDANQMPFTVLIDNTIPNYQHGVSISNFYTETTNPTVAMIAIVNNGYVTLEKVRRARSVGVLVDATGSVASTIVCRDWTMTNESGGAANSWIRFKQNAANTVAWLFENMGEIGRGEVTNLVTDDSLWIGGVIPTRITQIEPGRIASAP